MKDIRLPALGRLGADTATPASKGAQPDPAEAFDAVMSRLAPRNAPQAAPVAREPARVEDTPAREPAREPARDATLVARQAQARRDAALKEAREEARNDAQADTQATRDTAVRAPQAERAPRPSRDDAAAGSRTAKPAASAGKNASNASASDDRDAAAASGSSTGAAPTDAPAAAPEVKAAPVAATMPYDPAALAALAASLAGAAKGSDDAEAGAGASTAPSADAGSDAATPAQALDVFAAKPMAGDRHGVGTPGVRASAVAESDTPAAAASRRAPLDSKGAKDTLRIEAPLVRATEATQAQLADRLAATLAGDPARNVTAPSVAAAPSDSAAPLLAANLAATASVGAPAGTYSIAHAAVAAPVGSAAFGDEFAQRVVVFAGQKLQRADIAVTPADLGPIAVSIEVRGQEATLAFAAASPTTRTAIEDALPRLREMLSAQGLHLAGAHVGGDPRRDAYRPARNGTPARAGTRAVGGTDGLTVTTTTQNPQRRVGLIDIEV